jgi:hypothetical protein
MIQQGSVGIEAKIAGYLNLDRRCIMSLLVMEELLLVIGKVSWIEYKAITLWKNLYAASNKILRSVAVVCMLSYICLFQITH